MLSRDDVAINTPCGVDFSKMTRKEATKRFCGDCKKHVHDLSSMTETEARALLEAPATDGLCVRYVADERGKLLFLPDVPVANLTARKRAAMALSVMAASMSLTACMGASVRQPPPMMGAVEQVRIEPRRFELSRGETKISIVDEPGVLVDGNAPPPPPGQAPATHPFLSGSCSGDALACSEARTLLDTAQSTDDFIAKLITAGYQHTAHVGIATR